MYKFKLFYVQLVVDSHSQLYSGTFTICVCFLYDRGGVVILDDSLLHLLDC